MKKLLIMMMLSSPVMALECPDFSLEQLHVLQHSYDAGSDYGLGLTLATIAFQESSAGLNLVNETTKDYGIYQGNYKTICKQANLKVGTKKCDNEIKTVLKNKTKASEHAIQTLEWWGNYHLDRQKSSKTFQLAIRSYNAGFAPNSSSADKYWEKFKTNLTMIKTCINFGHNAYERNP